MKAKVFVDRKQVPILNSIFKSVESVTMKDEDPMKSYRFLKDGPIIQKGTITLLEQTEC